LLGIRLGTDGATWSNKMAGPRRAKPVNEGALKGVRMLIVEGRYYDAVGDALMAGATRALDEAKVAWDVVTVPGALEIPPAIAIALAADKRRYAGIVALGCVIRGETSHYDIVAGESARALMDLGVSLRVPIGNGILTVDTETQAFARARPEEGDKGGTAARAALALARLQRDVAKPRRRR
jgi:6,7-dimethyl-8-ribityllumazine synthase